MKDKELSDQEEESKQAIEVFPKVALEELKLQLDWSLWEHYECMSNQTTSFEDQMSVIAWFNDLIGFAKVWKHIPHSEIKNLFFDRQTFKVPM